MLEGDPVDEVSFRTAETVAPGTVPGGGQTSYGEVLPASENAKLAEGAKAAEPTSPQAAAQTAQALGPYPWILNPTIDLLFACGGVFWLAYLGLSLSNFGYGYDGNVTAQCFFALSVIGLHIFGDGHQPATLFRVYGSKITRDAIGKPVAAIAFVSLLAGLSTLLIPATTAFFIKLVLAWGFQHQLAQSYGIALIYCYKRKYYLNNVEKKIMKAMVDATMVFLIVRMFSMKDFGTFKLLNMYEVPFYAVIPEWVCTASLVVLQASVLVFVGMVVRKYLQEKALMPIPALLVIMTLTALPLIAGNHFALLYYYFSQWFFHSSQYLVVTSAFYFKEKGLPANVSTHQIGKMLLSKTSLLYFGIVFAVGFLLAFQLPMLMTDMGIANKAVCFLSIWVFLNVQHFWTDAFIWKLRDPVINKLLVS